MIKLKDLLKEIVDGQGYMTAEKFGSICLNQLTRVFPEYEIDIPYNVYETGGGFSWKKIPDVEFNRNDIVINRLSGDPSEYSNYVDSV